MAIPVVDMSSPPPPYHLTHDQSGNRLVPEEKSIEDQMDWWRGFAYVLWLDLGYLILLLLLLLTLTLIVIKTPGLRDLSFIKPCAERTGAQLSDAWEKSTAATSKWWTALVAALTGACAAISSWLASLCQPSTAAEATVDPPYAKLEEGAALTPDPTPPSTSPPKPTPAEPTATPSSPPAKIAPMKGTLILHLKSGFDLMALDKATKTKRARATRTLEPKEPHAHLPYTSRTPRPLPDAHSRYNPFLLHRRPPIHTSS